MTTARRRRTERLLLEAIGPQHADDLFALHRDDAVAAWWGGPWTLEEARERARTWGEAWQRDGVHKWMAYDRGSGELVGRGGLSRMELEGRPQLEVGWTVRAALWGRGYASEIGREALRFAFSTLGADEVVAFTEAHNARSRAVMERLGMQRDGDIVHGGASFVLYRRRR